MIKNGHLSFVIVSSSSWIVLISNFDVHDIVLNVRIDSCQVNNDFLLTHGHAHNVIASPCAALFLSSSICNSTMFLRNVSSYGNISLYHHLQKAI